MIFLRKMSILSDIGYGVCFKEYYSFNCSMKLKDRNTSDEKNCCQGLFYGIL